MKLIFIFLLASLFSLPAAAEQIKVAVASNFIAPMEKLAEAFEARSGHDIIISSGSSGKLFAQVQHGAPFDVFFSADQSKAAELVEAGLATAESRFTYSVGRLVLWSPVAGLFDGPAILSEADLDKLAIANPRVAPYGQAAVETMESLGILDRMRGKLVQGENIAQTFQFVVTGNAPFGFVAASQVIDRDGSAWLVPAELHLPIRQDAVLLQRAAKSAAARDFLHFVASERACSIIEAHGYEAPAALASEHGALPERASDVR